MPRKTSREQQTTWHQEFQQGSSIAQLAKRHGKDPRTIQRAIEEVERVGIARQAHTDLLKEGLRRHQDELLGLLREAAATADALPLALDLRFPGVPPPRHLAGNGWMATFNEQPGEYQEVQLAVEEKFEWQLLLEHLGRDAALRALASWKRAVLVELKQRLLLHQYVVDYINQQFKLEVSDDIREPGAIRPSALWEVYQEVVPRCVGEEPVSSFTVAPGESGEFLINGAGAGRLSPDAPDPSELAGVPETIAAGEVALGLREAHREVGQRAAQAREGLLEIANSFYLPGRCRSCRRFGA